MKAEQHIDREHIDISYSFKRRHPFVETETGQFKSCCSSITTDEKDREFLLEKRDTNDEKRNTTEANSSLEFR